MKELQYKRDFNLLDKKAIEVYSSSDYRLCVNNGKMGVYIGSHKSDFMCSIDTISDFERFLIEVWEEENIDN